MDRKELKRLNDIAHGKKQLGKNVTIINKKKKAVGTVGTHDPKNPFRTIEEYEEMERKKGKAKNPRTQFYF